MVAPTPQDIAWMRQIHLFHHLSDEEIAAYLEQMVHKRYRRGEAVAHFEEPPKGLCLIREGWVRLYRVEYGEAEPFGLLEEGDYFGTGGIIKGRSCRYDAIAVVDTDIYCWPLPYVQTAAENDARIRDFLQVVWRSRKRALRSKPRWLSNDEMVYLFLSRSKKAFPPYHVHLMALGILLAALAIVAALSAPLLLQGVALVLLGLWALWAVWDWIDWTNDYCVVTNRRIAWVEKVLLLYESRREAPMRTVIALSSRADYMGQVLGYGDVIARTYAGSVLLDRIDHPDRVEALLREYWQRIHRVVEQKSREAILRQIREKLGIPARSVDQDGAGADAAEEVAVAEAEESPAVVKKSRLARVWERLFKQRLVLEDGTIVYRKHPIRLFRRSVKPFLFLFLILLPMIFVGRRFSLIHQPTIRTVYWAVFALLLFSWFGWEFYQILDWDNDEYRLTPTAIVDVYRKPFGQEEKQESPLEKVENITYERPNLLAMLLNYGDVKIHVGTATMTFEAVGRPDRVQREIYERAEQLVNRRRAEEAERERERMLEMLKYYHDIVHPREGEY